jgi:hypothetical protein
MTWTELKQRPQVAVHCEGRPTEHLLIRDRCDTCRRHTRPALCPQRCGRFGEMPPHWTGPFFYKEMLAEAEAAYRAMYPEYSGQMTLF